MEDTKRILIFELNWMGDILFSFPFIRALRKTFPDAYITCAVVPRYRDLLANNPWINNVHVLSDRRSLSSIWEKLAFILKIRKEKYDTCFILKSSLTKTIIAALAGIEMRIGFTGKDTVLTEEVELAPPFVHRIDQILALACTLGVKEADSVYEYFISEEDGKKADSLLREAGSSSGRIVAINPGGNWDAKRWPEANFIKLAGKILEKFNDVEIMITGAKKDEALAERLLLGINSQRCYSTAGKTSINVLAGLFKRASLVISNDSGPMHLASAVGSATIALFGPTDPRITGPRSRGKNTVISKNSGCIIPCYQETCDMDYVCMNSITVDDVFRAVEEVLGG